MFKFAASMLAAYTAASEAEQFGFASQQYSQNPYGQGSYGQPAGYGGGAHQLQNKLKSAYPSQQSAQPQHLATQQSAYPRRHATQQHATQHQGANPWQPAAQQQAANPWQPAAQQQAANPWQPAAQQPSAHPHHGPSAQHSQQPSWLPTPPTNSYPHGAYPHQHHHQHPQPAHPHYTHEGSADEDHDHVDPWMPAADPDCAFPDGFTCDQEFSPEQYKYKSKAEQPAFAICVGDSYYVQLMQLPGKPIFAKGGALGDSALGENDVVTAGFNKLGRIEDIEGEIAGCSVELTGPTFFPLAEFDKWGVANVHQDPARGTVGECVNAADEGDGEGPCEFSSFDVEQNLLGLYGVLGRSMTFVKSSPDALPPVAAAVVDCCTIGYDEQGPGYPELETGYHPATPKAYGHYDSHGGHAAHHDHADLEGLIEALTARVEDLEGGEDGEDLQGCEITCEANGGLDMMTCQMTEGCEWDDGSCWSAVGPNACDGSDGENGENGGDGEGGEEGQGFKDYFYTNVEQILIDKDLDETVLDKPICIGAGETLVIYAQITVDLRLTDGDTPSASSPGPTFNLKVINADLEGLIEGEDGVLALSQSLAENRLQSLSVIYKGKFDMMATVEVRAFTSGDGIDGSRIQPFSAQLTYQIYPAGAYTLNADDTCAIEDDNGEDP